MAATILSDSEGASIHRLTINEHYAKAFAHKKEREELQKLKEKYGSDVDENDLESETDSEEAESEDELGEELTPAVDAAILRTLARIKRKDPSIYNQEADIFQEERRKTRSLKLSRPLKEKSKPVTMRQAVLESALNPRSRSPSPRPITHVEEQRALRDETISAFHSAVELNNAPKGGDDSEDLLVLREKSKDELEREDEEYREFLQREVGEDLSGLITIKEGVGSSADADQSKKKKRKREKVEDKPGNRKQKEEADQEFLINYILNRGWIDRSAQRIPTYKEIMGKRKRKSKADSTISGNSDSEQSEPKRDENSDEEAPPEDDDSFDELAETFESSYNFRYEEPDAAVVRTYPRNLPSLARQEDASRKEARERRKQRKEEEIQKKKEEVRRMKSLKMKELKAKLERIGREGGNNVEDSRALHELDLEGDWDPDVHDKQMAEIYGDDDDDGCLDTEKPHWEDDIDITDIVPTDQDTSKKAKKKKKKKKEGAVEDGVDVDAMDADVERPDDDEEWDGTEEMRKRKLNEYMDEIYGLEFNDIVGDMPTRFKYTPVQTQSYGLTPVEILMATDVELNQYLSIKKYAPYRKDTRWDATRKDRLKELRHEIAEREGEASIVSGKDAEAHPAKKRKGRKERMKMQAQAQEKDKGRSGEIEESKQQKKAQSDEGLQTSGTTEATRKKRKRRKKVTETVQE